MPKEEKQETPTMNEVSESLKELRELVEAKSTDVIDEAKMEKINELLDSNEEANAEVVKAKKEAESKFEDAVERIDVLEKELFPNVIFGNTFG